MKLKTTICVTDPDYFSSELHNEILEINSNSIDNELIIIEFFKKWGKKDKYTKVYALGVLNVEVL